MPQDIQATCADCQQQFLITGGEQDFFKSKGYEMPKRCGDCRWNRKQKKLQEEGQQ